jgi:enterochelin esterase-like enzyme
MSNQEAKRNAPAHEPIPAPVAKSPEILDGNKVVFRIYAPMAGEVTIAGEWDTEIRSAGLPLTKDEDGIWSTTVTLAPDYYTYNLFVDGVPTLDPANTWVKPGRMQLRNIVDVPGAAHAFADVQSVPHGEVRMVWYDSPTIGGPRRMHVYTPPGYEAGHDSYPVLYLLHGGGDDDSGWPTIGRAGFILDNLLAARLAQPMIVVMPNGSIDVPGFTFFLSEEERKSPAAVQKRMDTIAKMHDTFVADLLTTIMPLVESRYRAITDRDHRAIAGLSMGGAQTLRVAPIHLDLFSYIGVFSMGLQRGHDAGVKDDFEERNHKFLSDPARSNELVNLFVVASGKDDGIVTDGPRLLSETLTRHGIKHDFVESEGGHTWINWRQYLHDFAQKLFR